MIEYEVPPVTLYEVLKVTLTQGRKAELLMFSIPNTENPRKPIMIQPEAIIINIPIPAINGLKESLMKGINSFHLDHNFFRVGSAL